MLAAVSKFLRQIVPPVIATLIAAVLIAGFNRAFSTHLTQPRMAALHAEAEASERPPATPAAGTAASAVELVTEPVTERSGEKGGLREATKEAKDQIKIAEPGPARRTERVTEMRAPRQAELRQAEPYLMPAPAVAAPVVAAPVASVPLTAAPIVVAAPVVVAPAVRPEPVWAEPPMVTVPDRPRPLPQAQIEEPPAPQQNPIGAIVNTLKPSSLFARAREFGEKIEAAGNEILPSIRQ
jgi:hypothetical protein